MSEDRRCGTCLEGVFGTLGGQRIIKGRCRISGCKTEIGYICRHWKPREEEDDGREECTQKEA